MGLNFNGSTDAIRRDSGNPTITSFTMMAWVRITSFTGWHLPLSLGQSGGGGTYYAMGTSATTGPNNLVLTHPGGLAGTTTPTTGVWYHWAMTVAGTGASQFLGYRDGVLVITHSGSATPTNARMVIGNNTDSDYLNGDMCAVKVYDAVLTAAEILQEMRQIAPVRTANINTWLPLVDGSPTVDYSGVGGAMTSAGTPTFTSNPPVPWRARQRRLWLPSSASGPQTLNADLVGATGAPLAATLTGGAVSLAADLVAATAAVLTAAMNSVITAAADLVLATGSVFTPTVAPGAVSLPASLVEATGAVLTAALQSTITVTADLVAATASVFTATVTPGAITLSADLVAAQSAVFTATATPGGVTLSADLVGATAAVFTASVSGGLTLDADLVGAAAAPFAATITGGAVTLTGDLVGATGVVLAASMTGGNTLGADLVAATAAVLGPTLTGGAVTLAASLVGAFAQVFTASLEASGSVTVDADLVLATGSVLTAALQVDGAAGDVLGFYYRRRRA